MNPVPPSIGATSAPQVNLLPPEIAQRRKQGRAKVGILVAFLLFLVAVGAAWFLALGLRVAAEAELLVEQDRQLELNTELASYGYIDALSADYDNSVLAREWAGSTDIDWATHLNALLAAVPDGVTLTDVVIAQATPSESSLGDGTPFAQNDMGVLQFTGRAAGPELTSSFIESIDALPGFSGTWVDAKRIDAAAETNTVFWEYTGSTRITYTALSGRTVTEQTEVPAEVLEAVIGGAVEPTPEPSATAEGGN